MKKRWLIPVVFLLSLCVLMSSSSFAQEKKTEKKTEDSEKKKFKVDDKFLTTWKKVGALTKDIRSFKTEKSTTVAGVRGAEAEDAALKNLYYKGGTNYPSRMELKNAIEMLEDFVKNNPKDENVVQSHYFIAQCYVQLGDTDKGLEIYESLVKNHPESDLAAEAKEEIKRLKKK